MFCQKVCIPKSLSAVHSSSASGAAAVFIEVIIDQFFENPSQLQITICVHVLQNNGIEKLFQIFSLRCHNFGLHRNLLCNHPDNLENSDSREISASEEHGFGAVFYHHLSQINMSKIDSQFKESCARNSFTVKNIAGSLQSFLISVGT